ncbi:hypothetical protein [Stenotrophomonas sp. SY1]|uniref:hypothetical protein n=1 Tax=Stenotrophomonas sp. SY1 TaxID=477235 RepID=UPI001E2E9D3B|nr:hypothetical protein [Stenotrophomonas sp. SY1]MCD9088692.1 hypothetical protein [Stenotrophomonas sp. SY1]
MNFLGTALDDAHEDANVADDPLVRARVVARVIVNDFWGEAYAKSKLWFSAVVVEVPKGLVQLVKKARQLPHLPYFALAVKALNMFVAVRLTVRQVLVPYRHDRSIVDKSAPSYGTPNTPNVTQVKNVCISYVVLQVGGISEATRCLSSGQCVAREHTHIVLH